MKQICLLGLLLLISGAPAVVESAPPHRTSSSAGKSAKPIACEAARGRSHYLVADG